MEEKAENEKPKTYKQLVKEKLESMEVGDKFNKKEFILKHWGDYNYFLNQNFSNMMNTVKKIINDKLEVKKTYRSIDGNMTRLT